MHSDHSGLSLLKFEYHVQSTGANGADVALSGGDFANFLVTQVNTVGSNLKPTLLTPHYRLEKGKYNNNV